MLTRRHKGTKRIGCGLVRKMKNPLARATPTGLRFKWKRAYFTGATGGTELESETEPAASCS